MEVVKVRCKVCGDTFARWDGAHLITRHFSMVAPDTDDAEALEWRLRLDSGMVSLDACRCGSEPDWRKVVEAARRSRGRRNVYVRPKR